MWHPVRHLIALWQRYEHHLGVGAIATGFIFDLFLAKRPDSVVDNLLLCSYLFIAGAFIIILNLRRMRRVEREHPTEPLILLLILQFCFGGLASNLLVLYGKSGTLTLSALFIALLVALVFGNEFLRSRYSQLRFNVVVYYFLLLTYATIAAPTFIFHAVGDWVFLASGLISLCVIALFLFILYLAVLRKTKTSSVKHLAFYIGAVFFIFNGLYFFNAIPPVPLSLKNIGVYHSVLHYSSGGYLATFEPAPWYIFWRDTSAEFDYTPGESAFCFSAVYAPAGLSTPIDHRWEHYNTTTNQWDTVFQISFPISGGRAAGYEGYSETAAMTPGQWRCDVETSTGALIGRISFTAVPVAHEPALSTATL